MLLSSPRILGPLLSSLLVLALLLLLIFASAGSTTFSFGPCLVSSITPCSLYDDPLLYPVTDDGSDSEGAVFPSIGNGDFSVIPWDYFC